ncbi:14899_t:CDS:2, partial [Racocetra persica]
FVAQIKNADETLGKFSLSTQSHLQTHCDAIYTSRRFNPLNIDSDMLPNQIDNNNEPNKSEFIISQVTDILSHL